jgi:hypothetical protein
LTSLKSIYQTIIDMLEKRAKDASTRMRGAKSPRTLPSPMEEALVETLLPWWSKLVHRIAVAEGGAGKMDKGEIHDVEDQRVSP